jgi:DNA-binding MarR family transcriptional regulator
MMELSDTLELPVSIMVTFLGAVLWEAEEPMTSLEELAARTGQPPTTLSGRLRYLGSRYRPGIPGLGLVYTVTNGDNARKKDFGLTPRGRALAAHLEAIFERAASSR